MPTNDSANSPYDTSQEVLFLISVTQEPSWPREKFLHEYQKAHADIVREGNKHTGLPLSYVQVTASELPSASITEDPQWDFVTCLRWPNTYAIWKTFQDPMYQETAGKHIFCRLDQQGCIAVKAGEIFRSSPSSGDEDGETNGQFSILVFYRREGPNEEASDAWIQERQQRVADRKYYCAYSIWKDFTPKDTGAFFAGTQFSGGSWLQFKAVEQFTCYSREEWLNFVDEARSFGDFVSENTIVVGGSAVVVV